MPEECTFDRFELSHEASLFDLNCKYADVVPAQDVVDYLTAFGASSRRGAAGAGRSGTGPHPASRTSFMKRQPPSRPPRYGPVGGDAMDGTLAQWLHGTTRAVEVGGTAIIVIGIVVATARYLRDLARDGSDEAFHRYRSGLGRAILLGLEVLVAADIINTVAIEPTLHSLAVLAGIVAIRTFLSVSLEVEIEGRWPWRRAAGGGGENRRPQPSP